MTNVGKTNVPTSERDKKAEAGAKKTEAAIVTANVYLQNFK